MKNAVLLTALLAITIGSGAAQAASNKYIVLFKDQATQNVSEQMNLTDENISKVAEHFSPFHSLQNFWQNIVSPNTGKSVIINEKLWAINAIAAELSREDLLELASSGLIDGVYADRTIVMDDVLESYDTVEAMVDSTYGLQLANVDKLATEFPNIDGSGITVGVIDTGFDATHPDLAGKLLAFKDLVNKKTAAYDDHGHGTHVSGTIAGGAASGTRIGVAPKAKIVAAKVFSSGGTGQDSNILAGMQFMLDPDGNPATNDQPLVVSNSWGGPQKTESLDAIPHQRMLQAWIKAGMVPVFAAGNSGQRGAGTVGTPGALPLSFTVGAVDETKAVTNFSSRGPVYWKIADAKGNLVRTQFIKPDFAAAGKNVYSAMPGGKYGKMSGTSMATPHVAGILALVRQANPKLGVEDLRALLTKSSVDLGDKGKDNLSGFGLVDALAAVKTAKLTTPKKPKTPR